MFSLHLLDWGIRSLSFFNTIALFWLGLTVLLNAERRTWGTWLAGGGLVLGGVFFAGHSTVVGREFGTFDAEMEFWWRVGWLPFVSPPYLWFLAMAWFSGVLHQRLYRGAIILVSALGLLELGVLIMNPLPSYGEVIRLTRGTTLALGGIPLMVLAYPLYSALCIALSLMALRRPAASQRFMGELARRRARPWLVAASAVFLAVSLSVGTMAAWFVLAVRAGQLTLFTIPTLTVIKSFDFIVAGLLALSVVLVGRAMVSYEIFTGKALPRGGLYRQWRNSLILAASFGLLIGATLDLPIAPIYRLLLLTLLTTVLYALHSWRVYVDREQSMEHLRPFVASERLYERLLETTDAPDSTVPFHALCKDVLSARLAYLVPMGQLASLAPPALSFPTMESIPVSLTRAVGELAGQFQSPLTICVPLAPQRYEGAVWAVPLWSERGLIGMLLLGEKIDGALYTQEEMEIARATGERLIDSQASAEMARRLVSLQRQRLAESQVLDRRARHVLHDDVLPRLHTAMLTLHAAQNGSATEAQQEAATLLAEAHHEISNLLRAMPTTAAPQVARLGLLGSLRQQVTNELAGDFDRVTWQIDPEAERTAEHLSPLVAEVMFGAAREAIRNAALHARGGDSSRPLHLTISLASTDGLRLTVEDDGVGVGNTSRPSTGTGQGLTLHSTLMAVIGGTLTVESSPGAYTRVVLDVPTHSLFAHQLQPGLDAMDLPNQPPATSSPVPAGSTT